MLSSGIIVDLIILLWWTNLPFSNSSGEGLNTGASCGLLKLNSPFISGLKPNLKLILLVFCTSIVDGVRTKMDLVGRPKTGGERTVLKLMILNESTLKKWNLKFTFKQNSKLNRNRMESIEGTVFSQWKQQQHTHVWEVDFESDLTKSTHTHTHIHKFIKKISYSVSHRQEWERTIHTFTVWQKIESTFLELGGRKVGAVWFQSEWSIRSIDQESNKVHLENVSWWVLWFTYTGHTQVEWRLMMVVLHLIKQVVFRTSHLEIDFTHTLNGWCTMYINWIQWIEINNNNDRCKWISSSIDYTNPLNTLTDQTPKSSWASTCSGPADQLSAKRIRSQHLERETTIEPLH